MVRDAVATTPAAAPAPLRASGGLGLALAQLRRRLRPRGDQRCATGRGKRRWCGRSEPFRSTEIADDEKPRIVEAYLARWGYQVRPYFTALPNAADHPVFRIERP